MLLKEIENLNKVKTVYKTNSKSCNYSYHIQGENLQAEVVLSLFESGQTDLSYFFILNGNKIYADNVDSAECNLYNFILIYKMIEFFSFFDENILIPSLITIEQSDKDDPISSIEWYSDTSSLIVAWYFKTNSICYSFLSENNSSHGYLNHCNHKENINKIKSLLKQL